MTMRTDNTSLLVLAAVVLVAGFAAGRSAVFRSPPSPARMERTAIAELAHGDPTDAFPLLRKVAATGDASAAYHLGMMYEYGEGTAPDTAAAIRWLSRAADSGSAAAARELGALYLEGTAAVQDFAKARNWFAVAARQGDATALRRLGEMNAEGFGAPVDLVKAYGYYAAATARGSVYAAARRDRVAARLDPQQQSRGEAEARTILADVAPAPGADSKTATSPVVARPRTATTAVAAPGAPGPAAPAKAAD